MLPKLPYAYDALEPYIDAQTMQIHHDKHHQAYVDNLNKAIGGDPALARLSVEELLQRLDTVPAAVRTAVRNQGGGHANHSLFWHTLCPASKSGKPARRLEAALDKSFGGQDKFEEKLQAAAVGVFGSGWAWLSVDSGKNLVLDSAANQDSPLLTGKRPPARHRRLGACLLSELPEPPRRLPQGVCEGHQRGLCDCSLRRVGKINTAALPVICFRASVMCEQDF